MNRQQEAQQEARQAILFNPLMETEPNAELAAAEGKGTGNSTDSRPNSSMTNPSNNNNGSHEGKKSSDDEIIDVNSDRYRTPTATLSRSKWYGYTVPAVISVGMDMLFSYFLYLSVEASIHNEDTGLVQEFHGNPDGWITTFNEAFLYITTLAIGANAIGDLTAVTPVQDAHDVMTSKKSFEEKYLEMYRQYEQQTFQQLTTHLNDKQVKGAFYILMGIRGLITLFNYIPLSLADAISVDDLMQGSNKETQQVVLGGTSFFIAGLGALYYFLLTDQKLLKHAIKIAHDVFSSNREDAIWYKVMKNPLLSLEAVFNIASNAFYRGVAASYIAFVYSRIAAKVFADDNNFDGLGLQFLVLVPGTITALTTILSRSLAVTDKLFLATPSAQALQNAEIPRVKTFFDLLFVSFRALSVGWLASSSLKNYSELCQISSGLVAGLMTLLHGACVNISINKKSAALDWDEKRKGNQLVKDPVTQMKSSDLFDEIAQSYRKQAWFPWVVGGMNVLARFARLVAFVGFVWTLVDKFAKEDLNLDLGASPMDILSIAMLFGLPIAFNDGFFYQGGYEDAWSTYATKFKIFCHHGYGGAQYLQGGGTNHFTAAKADYDPRSLEPIVEGIRNLAAQPQEEVNQPGCLSQFFTAAKQKVTNCCEGYEKINNDTTLCIL